MSYWNEFPQRKEAGNRERSRRRTGAPLSRLGLTLAILALAGLAGCAREETKNQSEMTSFSSQGVEASLFSVPKEQLPRIQIVPVAMQKIERVLRLPGTVGYNMFHTTPVISQVGGPVTRLLAVPGQIVSQGQPLLYVQSPDYSRLRANFLNARDAYHVAEVNYKRSQDLYAHKAIAERDLLAAESTRNQARTNLQAAESALEVLGIRDPEQATGSPSSQIPVLSPIAGEVVERQAAPGQLLQAGATQCFTISNMHTVWVQVNVYQKDLPHVRLGESATIQTDSYPESFHGHISYLATALDPNSRTLAARIVTDNPHLELKKDMYVTALVDAGIIPNALVVPQSAVLRDAENHPFVYIQVGEDKFARRLVTLGESEGGVTQITNGLKAGEKVVGDGSLFLQFANSLR